MGLMVHVALNANAGEFRVRGRSVILNRVGQDCLQHCTTKNTNHGCSQSPARKDVVVPCHSHESYSVRCGRKANAAKKIAVLIMIDRANLNLSYKSEYL